METKIQNQLDQVPTPESFPGKQKKTSPTFNIINENSITEWKLTLLSQWMDLSTSKETATKNVNTEATDHVGVKAKERISSVLSSIFTTFKP